MTILDSNVWIAYLNTNDSQHKKAKKVFETTAAPIILPEYVIAEVTTVLAYHAGKETANQFLHIAQHNTDIKILLTEHTFFLKIIEAFMQTSSKTLSFIDISLLVLSHRFPVITFDNALAKAIQKNR